jgi:hypothetical protein
MNMGACTANSIRGRFIRYTDQGEPVLSGDKTIASLFAGIHYSLETPFKRFFPMLTKPTDQIFSPTLFKDLPLG